MKQLLKLLSTPPYKGIQNRPRPAATRQAGQGIVEYTILLAFLALVVYVIIQVLEPTIGNVFSEFVEDAPVAPPVLANYTPPPTYTPVPTVPPGSTNTPLPTSTPPPTHTPTPSNTPTATNTFTPSPTPPCLFGGPYTAPGRIQMENFRCGGPGVAFSDSTSSGPGSIIYRNDGGPAPEGPDLAINTDGGGGFHLGWVTAGEWVEYQVTAPTTQWYNMVVRYAAPNNVLPALQINVSSGPYTGGPFTFNGPPTGGWDTWGESTVLINLFAGSNTIRITGNTAATNGNFNYFDIVTVAQPTNTPTAAPSNTPVPTNTPAATNTPLPTATPDIGLILFVVGNPASLNQADTAVYNRLIATGNVVTIVDDNVTTTGDANGKDLVIISASVNAGAVNTKFRDVAVPVLLWKYNLLDDMNMVTNAGTDNNENQVNIINSGHPLAGGLGNGLRTVTTNNQSFTWGQPNVASAISVATIDNDTNQKTIFAYDTGSSMVGMEAPAPRVSFFFTDNTAAALNANGWALFDAAVNWAKQ